MIQETDENASSATPVEAIVRRPFALPTSDVIRGLIAQVDSGVVTFHFGGVEHHWKETLGTIADYLDRVETR